jgi:hypothetical protein
MRRYAPVGKVIQVIIILQAHRMAAAKQLVGDLVDSL